MAESELSGNTISKGQEKPRKTSTVSSQSPKAAQPSCLRGAFIRIFLKRAEPNNRTEEDPSSSQHTEDQEEVRGKKRRVTGSIFRLPCLRPAETTGNDIQDKTEEQSNDVVQEEELKPYSKASFLRKIRCYRLMREKDATEKDKVIEMAQRKHDKENAEVKRYKERVLEQTEECLNHDKVMGEKGKDTTEQAKSLGEAGNDFQEQDFNVEDVGESENSLRKQECCTGKLSGSGEESVKMEDPAQGVGSTGKDLAEQESSLSVLLVGEVSLLDDKNLAEQEDQMGKVEQKEHVLVGEREQKEDMLEQKNCAAKVRDLDNALSDKVSQPEDVGKQEKQEEAMEKDLPKQEGCDIVITDESVGAMQKYLPENKCPTDELGDGGNYLSEQEGHKEKVGNTENNLVEDMGDTMSCLAEKDGQKEMKGLENRDKTEKDSQGDIADKMENKVLEKDSAEDSHVEKGRGQENNLVDEDSHTEKVENTKKETSQQDIVKDGPVGDFEDKTVEISGVPVGGQDEENSTNNIFNQGVTMTILNQETVISETSQLQDSSAERTLGSEDNEEHLASIRKKTTTINIITCTSEEEVLKSANAMDLTHQEPHILHTCVNNEDDGMGCENADLGSLREEVKDMVEWMVQEASDRLSHYAQDGTG